MILSGLTHKTLDFHGKHFNFDNVPMELAPLQKPHPPIWYGAHAPDSAARAARRSLNIVNLDPTAHIGVTVASYRKAWQETKGTAAPLPKIGLGRFIVVAETDAQAMRLASRAYGPGIESFTHLPRLLGRAQTHPRPARIRAADGARPRHRRLARNGAGAARLAACRDRLQLRGRAIRVRRHDAR